MKKVVYLAPIFLLSFLGKNALAGQVEHVSNLDSALEQASAINNSTADTNKNTTVLQSQVLRINKTNQTAIPDSIKQSTGFQDKKIEANTNVTINNPANNRIHVNWVDANGQNINANGYDIDLTTIQNNSDNEYHWLPKGYQLHNPNGKYTVSGGAFNGTNLKASTDYHSETYRTVYKTETWYGASRTGWLPKTATYEDVRKFNGDKYRRGIMHIFPTQDQAESWGGDSDGYEESGPKMATTRPTYRVAPVTVTNVPKTAVETPAYTTQTLPVAFVDANNNLVGMIQNYTGKVGTTKDISLTVPTGYKLADGASLPTSVTFQNSTNPLLVKVVPSGKTQRITNNTINVKFVDQESGQQVGTDVISLTKAHDGTNYYNTPAGYGADVGSYTIKDAGYWRGSVYNTPSFDGYIDANLNDAGYKFSLPDSAKRLKLTNDEAEAFATRAADSTAYGVNGYLVSARRTNDGLLIGETYVTTTLDHYYGSEYPADPYIRPASDLNQHSYLLKFSDKTAGKVVKKVADMLDTMPAYSDGTHYIMIRNIYHKGTSFTDNLHDISNGTVTVPVHRTNRFTFSDNSGNVKSYSGNTVNVILEHQTKRIDPNNSSLNLDANNQLHLINTNQEQPKQSTANFKVGYLLDLVTNNKIIDTDNAQALNNTKIFTINPSLPIGYDSLNTKLLTLNL